MAMFRMFGWILVAANLWLALLTAIVKPRRSRLISTIITVYVNVFIMKLRRVNRLVPEIYRFALSAPAAEKTYPYMTASALTRLLCKALPNPWHGRWAGVCSNTSLLKCKTSASVFDFHQTRFRTPPYIKTVGGRL